MRRTKTAAVCCVLLVTGIARVWAHPGGHRVETDPAADEPLMLALAEGDAAVPAAPARDATTGQGKYRFRVRYTSSHLPEKAVAVLKKAHGGFAVDTRPGRGEIYFALPGAGIIRISGDLKSAQLLDTEPPVRDTNQHNTLIWYPPHGEPYLAFPSNDAGKVFTTTLDGKIVHTLDAPTGQEDLGSQSATEYFRNKMKFVPTDVEQVNGLYYITTGYSALDMVLTAKLTMEPFDARWHPLSFGGRGTGPGQFGTGHGITLAPGGKRLDVADRPHGEIDRFGPDGRHLGTVKLPEGSWPCDVFHHGRITVVGCLHGPDRSKGAPIYILEDDKVVSTLMPREDLGLTNFQHIHNAVCVTVQETLYIIAQSWNPGDFAILQQVRPD